MAKLNTLLSVLGLAMVGCFASARPTSGGPIRQVVVARAAPPSWSGCGSPGRERCDPEPANQHVLADNLRLACAEDCSRHWMESSGVVAASDRPLATRRAELSEVAGTLLKCFGMCDRRQAELAMANMPPGVEPCTEAGFSPNNSTCLEYSCQRYGKEQYMLPVAVRSGEACEVPATKEAGICLAGSCVPASAQAEACSAYAVRSTAIYWMNAKAFQQYCEPTATDSCALSKYGRSNRVTLLDLLSCEDSPGELNPPATPWGHWPVSLTQDAK